MRQLKHLSLGPAAIAHASDPAGESTIAILETLLRPTTNEQCELLVEASEHKFRRLSHLGTAELRQIGLTTRAIEKLRALVEFAKRYGEEEWLPGQPLRGSYDIYAHCRERLAGETTEQFYAVLLDNKNRKLKEILVSKGSLTSSIVHPRDIYLPVIRESAAAVIFYHNHPSGDPTPSREDIEVTRRLREVGDLIGVRVLDHIVVGKGRYVSFVDDGYW